MADEVFRYCSLASELFYVPEDARCEACKGDCEVPVEQVLKGANQAEAWRDRYCRLRALTQECGATIRMLKAQLAMNVAGVAKMKAVGRAQIVQGILAALLKEGSFRFVERNLDDWPYVEIDGSIVTVRNREALAALDAEIKSEEEPMPAVGQKIKEEPGGHEEQAQG